MTTYLIDGIDLNRWIVSRGTTYRSPVSTERHSTRIPGRHGVVASGVPTYTEPLVTLVLSPHVDLAESDDLESLVGDLTALAAAPSVTLAREVGGIRREAAARLVSMDFDPQRFRFDRYATATAVFELPGVFWRDPTPTDLTIPAGTSTAAGAGSAPVADAVVRFAAAASFPSLVDVTSGTSIGVERTMAAGRYVYVDVGTLRAWSSASSSAWAGGTDESQYLSYGPAGPLQLWPKVAQPNADVTLQYDPTTGRVTVPGAQVLHHGDGRYTVGDVPVLTDGRGRYRLDTAVTTRGYRVQASHAAVVRARRAWL